MVGGTRPFVLQQRRRAFVTLFRPACTPRRKWVGEGLTHRFWFAWSVTDRTVRDALLHNAVTSFILLEGVRRGTRVSTVRASRGKWGALTSDVSSLLVKRHHTRIGQSIGAHEARWRRWEALADSRTLGRVLRRAQSGALGCCGGRGSERRGSGGGVGAKHGHIYRQPVPAERSYPPRARNQTLQNRTRCGDCRSQKSQSLSAEARQAPASPRHRPSPAEHNTPYRLLGRAGRPRRPRVLSAHPRPASRRHLGPYARCPSLPSDLALYAGYPSFAFGFCERTPCRLVATLFAAQTAQHRLWDH